MEPTRKRETKVFNIVVIVISIIFIIVFAVDAYRWNLIRNNTTETAPVLRSDANTQFWLMIILILLALAIIIWALVDLFSKPKRAAVTTVTKVATASTPVAVPLQAANYTTPLYSVERPVPARVVVA